MGAINQWRLYDFRAAISDENPRGQLDERGYFDAIRRQKLVPLRRLLTDCSLLTRRDPNIPNFYAEAWALVHYLQRTRRKELADYIRCLSTRKPHQNIPPSQELADFERSFGKPDSYFERAWVRWILDQPFKPTQVGL
jgi:hypothetical protein